jgi:hypothetical protein
MTSKPTVFIGSSSEGLEIAQAIGEDIKSYADATIWNENVFDYGRGYLEELLCEIDKHDFAILVMSPDDKTESREKTTASPRDNVIFECGLFMGRLGRDRTFVVCDKDVATKLPSDFSGVSLITYDGSRVSENLKAAVRGSCGVISRAIRRPQFWQLAGEWASCYRFAYDDEEGMLDEEVVIRPACGKVCIESKSNKKGDNYIAYGKLVMGKHLTGEWESVRPTASSGGPFMLTLHPLGNLMYGYFIAPDDDFRILHATWVLAKKAGATDDEVKRLLLKGERILRETSKFAQPPAAPAAPGVIAETRSNGGGDSAAGSN